MKIKGARWVIGFFLLSILAGSAPPAAPAQTDDLAARIRRLENGVIPNPGFYLKGTEPERRPVFDRMKDYRVPGVSIAVINDFKIEWAKGYGILEAGGSVPVTPQTLFQAASISKPVAAAAALHFVEAGRLSLDEDVNAKLKSWKIPDNDWTKEKKVTLRRILSHSAGLTVHGFPGYEPGTPIPSLSQILDGEKPANTSPIRVDIEIGSKFRYAGGGYTVMQQLLMDVLGKPFPEIMKENVLTKAGMIDSTYEQPLPKDMEARAARGHRMNGSLVKGNWHVYPEMAAAGLWTTPSDLCRFALEIISSMKGTSTRVLSAAMAKEMLTIQKAPYGLGLSLAGAGASFSFSHGGGNEGFRCLLFVFPERGQGAAVMTNGDGGGDLMTEIFRGIALEYGWPDLGPRERDAARLESAGLDAYAGIYEFSAAYKITVTREGDRLVLDSIVVNPTGWEKVAFYPNTAGSFFNLKTADILTFSKDAEGKVTGFALRQGPRERKASKKSTHSTSRAEAGGRASHSRSKQGRSRGMLRVNTERRFLPRFSNLDLAPPNV